MCQNFERVKLTQFKPNNMSCALNAYHHFFRYVGILTSGLRFCTRIQVWIRYIYVRSAAKCLFCRKRMYTLNMKFHLVFYWHNAFFDGCVFIWVKKTHVLFRGPNSSSISVQCAAQCCLKYCVTSGTSAEFDSFSKSCVFSHSSFIYSFLN